MFIAVFLLLGWLNFQVRELPIPQNDISHLQKKQSINLIGLIDGEPSLIEDRLFFALKAEQANGKNVSGKVTVISKAGALEYGDRVELSGWLEELDGLANPGLFSFADYLNKQGVYCRFSAIRSPPRVISRTGGNLFKRSSIALRKKLIVVPQKTLPEPYATLLASIVFGSRASKTPPEIKETYKRAGVAHLLVASGMHLGILIGVCLFVIRSTRLPLWLGVLIVSGINFIYALMTGFGPSILRAAIMVEIMLLGLLFEREKEVYTSLALAAFIILLFNPKYLFDVGFQLSFAATVSLVYIAPVLAEKMKSRLPRSVASMISVAVAPVLISIPITLFHFNQASLIGVLTNMILLPWVGLLVVLGFVATVLGALCLPIGELINSANLILLWLAHFIITRLAELPFAQVNFAAPTLPLIIGYYLGLAGLVEVIRRGKFPKMNKFRLISVGLAIVLVLFWNIACSNGTTGLLITVLDVGQGDAIFVKAPNGQSLLIDGGERTMGEKIIVPFLRKQGVRKLDLVVLTHPHEDHVGGLPEVLGKIEVDAVLEPGFDFDSAAYRRFLGLIKKNKIKYQLARAGQAFKLGPKVKMQVLHPSLPFDENVNNVSVVLRLQYGKFSMLFTGDNEQEGEASILELFDESVITSTILKAGHHGSATSTSDGFLAAVKPKIAVISCGKRNKFKHPHRATLDKLDLAGVKVYRTDQDGAITIKSDGKSYAIAPARPLEKLIR